MARSWLVLVVAVIVALTHLTPSIHSAPVPEENSQNELTSSGDSVDPGPTIPLDKLEENEYEIVQESKPTPAIIYSTMTPAVKKFTTASTTLPPVPPTTTYPTIPPRTSVMHIVMLETTVEPLVKVDLVQSSTKSSSETSPPTVPFTTVSVEEAAVEDGKSTTLSPVLSTTEAGPLLVGIGDKVEDKSTLASTTVEGTTKVSTAGVTEEDDDDAIMVEVESEVTEKVVLVSSSTSPPSTTKTAEDDGGIMVDVVTVDTKPKSSTQNEVPSTQPTTTTSLPTESTVASTPESVVKVEVIDSNTVQSSPATSTTAEKTTEDEGVVVIPVDKSSLPEENKLEKNDTTKIVHSTKTGEDEQQATVTTSQGVLKGSEGVVKHTKYGVQSNLITDPPATPEVEVDDSNVNATLIGESKQGGLSYAARTGIAMGCIVGFWIIIGPLVCLICKMRDKKRDKKEKEERDAREKANNSLVEEMVKAELQKTPNGDKKKMYNDDKHDDGEIEPITIGDSDSMPYIDADANSRDTAL